MRNFIRLAEALFLEGTDYPSVATPDGLLRMIQDIHHRPEDFENGDINHRIYKFKQYHLTELPITNLYSPWDVDATASDGYADRMRGGELPPPIIYDADTGIMIDGGHRLEAARLANLKSLPAYVGRTEDMNPDWDDDETL